jgi:predicted transcriptional regulator of viral defense system
VADGNRDWQALAQRQCGVISWQQLASCGLSANGVLCLRRAGRVERLVRSVYGLPGWPSGWKRDLWIALLAAGRGAVVSHQSAAALHELDGFKPGPVELSVPKGRRPRLTGVRVDHLYRVNVTWFDSTRQIQGLPVTSVTDTLLELGSIVDADRVERGVECALRREQTSVSKLEAALGQRGDGRNSTLRDVLRRRPPGAAPTESDAETLFPQLTRVAGLPDPGGSFRFCLAGGATASISCGHGGD